MKIWNNLKKWQKGLILSVLFIFLGFLHFIISAYMNYNGKCESLIPFLGL